MMQDRVNYGLIGLGTMGAALALNIAEKGYPIAVFNRTGTVTDEFIASAGDLAPHRRWMWRSIALTVSAVTLRLILGVGLGALHLPFPPVYLLAAWGSWTFNLTVCELLLRWPRRRVQVPATQALSGAR